MVDETLIYHLSLVALNSVTFVFNLLIITIFVRYWRRFFPKGGLIRRLRAERNHNKYLLSMVFADLLVGVFGTSTGVMLKLVQTKLIYKLCGLIPLYSCMFVSVFSLILLTIDRLLAVKHPLYYDSLMSNSCVTKSIALCWIIPILTTVSQMIIYVASGSRLELKIRNTMLTIICLTGFIILFITNYMLIQKYKKQRGRSAELKEMSRHLTSAIEERLDNDVPESEGCNGRESNQHETEVANTDSTSPVCPLEEAHYTVLCPEPKETDEPEEDLVRFRNSIAFFCGRKISNAIGIRQPVRRNTLPSLLDRSYEDDSTKGYVTILSSFKRNKIASTECLKGSMTMSIDFHACTKPDVIPEETEEIIVDFENNFPAPFDISHEATRKSFLSKLHQNVSDLKITILCICIIVAFLICWLPLVGYRFSYVVGRTTNVPWFRRLSQCLALSNSLFNPFIYFMVRKDLRQLLRRLFFH